MEKQKLGFMGACKEFFGLKPGQNLAQFRDEMKELTDKDRRELSQMLADRGIDHERVM